MSILTVFYAIRNNKGQYFKARKYGKDDWTDKIEEARTYVKPGPARALITHFASSVELNGKTASRIASSGDIMELVELRVTEIVAFKEVSRVRASLSKKEKAEYEQRKYEVQQLRRSAEIKLQEAQDTIDRLNRDQTDGGGWRSLGKIR